MSKVQTMVSLDLLNRLATEARAAEEEARSDPDKLLIATKHKMRAESLEHAAHILKDTL